MHERGGEQVELTELVSAAQAGDLQAYARLIHVTQAMVYAVARRVLRDHTDALDATQETYLRAYRALAQLSDPAAFAGFLRRIAIRSAHDVRRARRMTFAPLLEIDAVPVLDEREQRWSEAQRAALSRAIVTLSNDERRITERFYHGHWSAARLAADAQVSEPTMRKRLQRIRDKLREEIEMIEQRSIDAKALPNDLSDRVVELLARPQLVELPENPVGKLVALLREQFSDYAWVDTPEIVDLAHAQRRLQHDPVYVPLDKVFHLDGGRILRYDLTLPLVLEAKDRGAPLHLIAGGKVYRDETESTTHLSAFHQLELLWLDEHERAEPWTFLGRMLRAIDNLLPHAMKRVSPSSYPFCTRAWDIGVEIEGEYQELAGCGVYTDDVLRLLGGDPARHTALGLGLGLERFAALLYGMPDIRRLGIARV
jgi:RNA polymerase sigma factor (sigma-70 family)